MQQQQWGVPPTPPGPPRKGRGFVVAGGVLLGLSIIGVAISILVLGRSFDPDSLTRDVVASGPVTADVPGRVGFRVIEDLSAPDEAMSVGVALEPETAGVYNATTCSFLAADGTEVVTRNGGDLETFLAPEFDSDTTPFVVADDLEPGDYSVECSTSGEPSAATEARFTVGRVVSASELFGIVGPVLWIVVAVGVGAVVGLVGLVLLVVGLVQNNKARRGPPGPAGPPMHQPPPPGGYGDGWR